MSEAWQSFDRAATHYDQYSGLQQQSANRLLAWMGEVAHHSVWMDAGCGTGVLSRALADQGAHVWAVDRALNMLAGLRQHEGVQVICADLNELPLPPAMLDGWVSNFALHWLGPQCLPMLMEYVREGGEVWCAVPVAGSWSAVKNRYPQLPVFAFDPAQAWLDAAEPWLVESQIFQLTQPFDHVLSLLRAVKASGGAYVPSPHTPTDLGQMRAWLADRQPIELNYQVLMMHLKVGNATWQAWLNQLQEDPRFIEDQKG